VTCAGSSPRGLGRDNPEANFGLAERRFLAEASRKGGCFTPALQSRLMNQVQPEARSRTELRRRWYEQLSQRSIELNPAG